MQRCLPILLAAGLAALTGCSTVSSRIREKQAVFDTLPPATRAEIRRGQVGVGFTPDMVYMAIGKPDEMRERVAAAGHESVWKYNMYYDRYVGSVRAGYRRWVRWDPRINAYRIYDEPMDASVYQPVRETYIRVTFRDGKVTAIDQMTS
ncbi:MAG TPA: hypothetical protein VMD31_10185 [Opitutaceae bacterium]|nr:hypothetical protein [Opitutaceae bacterium]